MDNVPPNPYADFFTAWIRICQQILSGSLPGFNRVIITLKNYLISCSLSILWDKIGFSPDPTNGAPTSKPLASPVPMLKTSGKSPPPWSSKGSPPFSCSPGICAAAFPPASPLFSSPSEIMAITAPVPGKRPRPSPKPRWPQRQSPSEAKFAVNAPAPRGEVFIDPHGGVLEIEHTGPFRLKNIVKASLRCINYLA
jgi:hypothetical protein